MTIYFVIALVTYSTSLLVGALPSSPRFKATSTSIINLLLSGFGLTAGLINLSGADSLHLSVNLGFKWLSIAFSLTRIGALFLVLVSFTALTTTIYGITQPPKTAVASTCISRSTFIFSMMAVVAAANATTFTFGWELMTISSAVLVASDIKKYPSYRGALIWYLTMSQVSAISLILGFSAVSSVGKYRIGFWWLSFSSPSHVAASGLGLGLLILAFGIKMGLLPVHVWLPKAHPAAPAEISALMSGSMVAMGVYGMILTVTLFGRDMSILWGDALIVVGAATAVYSIIKAAIEDDLKVLLAQSTSENMGLIAIAIGTYICTMRSQERFAANCALLAAILLTFAHAFFKQILFMAAGSIYSSSRTKRINELGGLGTRMRFTSTTFVLGSIGATALPPSLTFIAEWLLFQTLSHSTSISSKAPTSIRVLFPIAVAALALTTGLAVVTFTKVVGIALLGLPRTKNSDEAQEVPVSTWIGPLSASIAVFAPAIFIGFVAHRLDKVLSLKLALSSKSIFSLNLPTFHASVTPIAILGLFVVVGLIVGLFSGAISRSTHTYQTDYPWGCGKVAVDPHFQSSASGFTEPILRIFDDIVNPGRDVEVSHLSESTYLKQRHLRTHSPGSDLFEIRLLRPAIKAIESVATRVRRLQGGSLHLYLIYAFIGLISVVVISSL